MVFWAGLTINVDQESNGTLVHRIVLRYITERKQAEEAQQENQQRVIRSFSHLKKDGKNQRALQFLRYPGRIPLSLSAQFPRALP